MTSLHRVLVIEDHHAFRRLICELLQQRSDVQIVGEAANGVDALRQAAALRPDVVLLDIGLPGLSGIEVAARLRVMVPDAKVIFVTIESSYEVMEEAFNTGAHGYVYKPRAQRDVLPVLDAVIRGGRFVSGGLERIARGDGLASHRHHVLFYSSDAVLVDGFSRFIAGALAAGNAVIACVSEERDQSLQRELRASHADVALAIRQERYVRVNIGDVIAKVMVNGRPDTTRFLNACEELLADVARRLTDQHAKIVACGECSSTVWAHGNLEAAIQLEHLWDEIGKTRQMDIMCAYPLTARDESVSAVRGLCAEHTTVEIR